MKKQILKIGKVLSKKEQKAINGGVASYLCTLNDPCYILMGPICTDVCMHNPEER